MVRKMTRNMCTRQLKLSGTCMHSPITGMYQFELASLSRMGLPMQSLSQ